MEAVPENLGGASVASNTPVPSSLARLTAVSFLALHALANVAATPVLLDKVADFLADTSMSKPR